MGCPFFRSPQVNCSGKLYADRAMLKQQLFERSEFCCLIAIAKYNSHAEISPVSINDVKDGVKIKKRIQFYKRLLSF